MGMAWTDTDLDPTWTSGTSCLVRPCSLQNRHLSSLSLPANRCSESDLIPLECPPSWNARILHRHWGVSHWTLAVVTNLSLASETNVPNKCLLWWLIYHFLLKHFPHFDSQTLTFCFQESRCEWLPDLVWCSHPLDQTPIHCLQDPLVWCVFFPIHHLPLTGHVTGSVRFKSKIGCSTYAICEKHVPFSLAAAATPLGCWGWPSPKGMAGVRPQLQRCSCRSSSWLGPWSAAFRVGLKVLGATRMGAQFLLCLPQVFGAFSLAKKRHVEGFTKTFLIW